MGPGTHAGPHYCAGCADDGGAGSLGRVLARIALLSDRELEVFRILAEGASNRSISRRLRITERTVKAHVTQILIKTGLCSRAQVGIAAFAWTLCVEEAYGNWVSVIENAVMST